MGISLTPKELDRLIASGESASLLDVEVTPALARAALRYNKPGDSNRELRRNYVAELAEVQSSGFWSNTGEPIIFSDDAILNDGQHRLHATLVSGITCLMDFRFGIPRAAFMATNSGVRRTGADALGIAGFPKSNVLAAICRLADAYERGLPGAGRSRIPNGQVIAMVSKDERFLAAAKLVQHQPKALNVTSLGTLFYLGLRAANPTVVEVFADEVRRPDGNLRHPAKRLREKMLEFVRSGEDKGAGARIASLAHAIQAWEAYRKGREVSDWWEPRQPYPKVTGSKS
jgi:hypothetical protein